MDRRSWTGVVAGALGTAAAVLTAARGEAIAGSIAAVACGLSAAATVVNAQRVERAERRVAEAEEVREAAERQVGEMLAEAAQPHPSESVYDRETGLLDHRVFAVTFDRKVAAARRHLRPLSLVLIDLGPELPDPGVAARRAEALSLWGDLVRATLRDSDVACRVGDSTFGVMCEDTTEAGGVWVAERLQIAAIANGRGLIGPFRAAVATYPNHGLAAEELQRRAWAALGRARESDHADRLGRVELPTAD